jgi:epoxyqueuosine reductase
MIARAVSIDSPGELTRIVLDTAARLGFHRVGIASVEPPRRYGEYTTWLDADYHGSMSYMAADDHRAARRDLKQISPTARSAIVVALAYSKSGGDVVPADRLADGPRGFVSRYARGADYHHVIKQRLRELTAALSKAAGRDVQARSCVDSAPVLERELAERAGLGFVAKNTMLIAPGLGSYVLLGELLVDVELEETAAEPERPRCGSCRACLDACPTQAFADEYVLDARRCISYLTIEHRGSIPRELRRPIGTMIFGCDICQQVCPFNAVAPDRTPPDPELTPRSEDAGVPALLAVLTQGANQRRKMVDGTAMRRVNREQLLRNVCVALGNAGDPIAIDELANALSSDRSPLVRGHAAWALGQLGASEVLAAAEAAELDPEVCQEIQRALADASAYSS